jgi:hypothetical protein
MIVDFVQNHPYLIGVFCFLVFLFKLKRTKKSTYTSFWSKLPSKLYRGARGGLYTINSRGKKTYKR